jgi:hypothetical protein
MDMDLTYIETLATFEIKMDLKAFNLKVSGRRSECIERLKGHYRSL